MTARPPPRLLALSTGTLQSSGAKAFLARMRAAREAGLDGSMLREPDLGDREFVELARALRELFARERGGFFCVHDRAHVAASVGADAVHLGHRSLAPRELRGWLPPSIAIGLSTHAGDDRELWLAADYLIHGPVFDTPSKRGLVEPIGLDGLRAAATSTPVPLLAIGGIRPEHVGAILATGARGVAVLAAIAGSDDPARSTARFVDAFGRESRPDSIAP